MTLIIFLEVYLTKLLTMVKAPHQIQGKISATVSLFNTFSLEYYNIVTNFEEKLDLLQIMKGFLHNARDWILR